MISNFVNPRMFQLGQQDRLQTEQMQRQNMLAQQQQRAFNQYVQQLPKDQQLQAQVYGPANLPAMEQRVAESRAQARQMQAEFLEQSATEYRNASQREGFDEGAWFQRQESLAQYQGVPLNDPLRFEEMVRQRASGLDPLGAGGRDYNLQGETLQDSQGNVYRVVTDPRDEYAPPRYIPLTPGAPQQPVGRLDRVRMPAEQSGMTPGQEALVNEVYIPELQKMRQRADRAYGARQRARLMAESLNPENGLYTGGLGTLRTRLAEFAMGVGASDDFVSGIQNLEQANVFEAIQNTAALALRNPDSGFGLTGNTSNRDVEFLLRAVPNLRNVPEANALLVAIMEQRAQNDIELYDRVNRHLSSGGSLAEIAQIEREFYAEREDDTRRLAERAYNILNPDSDVSYEESLSLENSTESIDDVMARYLPTDTPGPR